MRKIKKQKKLAIELVALLSFSIMSYMILKGNFLPFRSGFLGVVAKYPQLRGIFLLLIAITVLYMVVDFLSASFFLNQKTRTGLLWIGLLTSLLGVLIIFTLKSFERRWVAIQVKNSKSAVKKAQKKISLHALVGQGKKATLKYKIGESSHKEINGEDRLGRTPLGLALLKNDLEAIDLLLKDNKIDVSKASKNHPDITTSPLRWAVGQVFGSNYTAPVGLAKSESAVKLLEKAKLTAEERAALSDRLSEIQLKRLDDGFFTKYKNEILFFSGTLGCLVGVWLLYKYLPAFFNFRVLLSISAVYGVGVMTWYATDWLFARKVAKLEGSKGLDWGVKKKDEYNRAFFLRRLGMTWRLYHPIVPTAVELESNQKK